MNYITTDELNTHLHLENLQVISRGDDAIAAAAIDGAVEEARGYLGDYDTAAIFGATGEQRHALLLIWVKDIAVWHFINLCNAGVEMELRKNRYERAISWLKGVQKGDITPGLPVKENSSSTLIMTHSNPKRTQHF